MAATAAAEESPRRYLGALLDAGNRALVTLVAGDTELAAHRAVLSATSPVFEAMFRSDMLEAGSGQVEVADVEGPVLRELLCYCYTLQAPQLPAMAAQLLAVADRYDVAGLKAQCEQQLAAQLSVENAAATAVLAVQHCCPSLKQAAVAVIKGHTHQVMATQGWSDAVLRQPKHIVEVSKLLTDTPPESRVPATVESGPTTGNQSRSGQPQPRAVAAVPPTDNTPPPDAAAVSRMRCLSEDERCRRLRKAAKQGAVQELQALLAAGTNVEASDGGGWTALHWAACKGREQAVRCLIEGGAEVEARNSSQNTPLHIAATYSHTGVVQALLASGADCNARGESGMTPLHWGALCYHTDTVRALKRAGASLDAWDSNKRTPMDFNYIL